MTRRWIAVIMLLGGLTLSGSLMADNGKGNGKGNPHANRFDNDDRDEDRDHDRRRHHDDDRWERRGGYEYRVYDRREGMPPGWKRGKKTGWGNCGLPPGQAKKYGCQTYVYESRTYYYYEDNSGHIIIRRPSIHIDGGSIDIR
jgi:hypothetical protein